MYIAYAKCAIGQFRKKHSIDFWTFANNAKKSVRKSVTYIDSGTGHYLYSNTYYATPPSCIGSYYVSDSFFITSIPVYYGTIPLWLPLIWVPCAPSLLCAGKCALIWIEFQQKNPHSCKKFGYTIHLRGQNRIRSNRGEMVWTYDSTNYHSIPSLYP